MHANNAKVIDLADDAGKDKAAEKQRNAVAMANLSMAFETKGLFGMIYKTMSKYWPAGLAYKVVVELFNKYNPDDRISRVELRAMLNGVSMKDSQDPSVLFDQIISAIRNRYDTATHQIDEEELMAVVMSAAPEKYTLIITSEQCIKGSKLALDDLEEVMYQKWRQSKGSDTEVPKINLSGFEGYCYQCKQQRHRADQCPN